MVTDWTEKESRQENRSKGENFKEGRFQNNQRSGLGKSYLVETEREARERVTVKASVKSFYEGEVKR